MVVVGGWIPRWGLTVSPVRGRALWIVVQEHEGT